jgi:hypothetical protein
MEATRDDIADILRWMTEGIPEDRLWTRRELRIRLSHGIDAKRLSQDEIDEWLERDATMSGYTLNTKFLRDELCPIRQVPIGQGNSTKRVPEKLVKRHLREQQEDSRPESLKQIS